MAHRTHIGTVACLAAVVTTLAALPATSAGAAPAARVDARVIGGFSMLARVTTAVNVRGERAGQRLRREWLIVPVDCTGSICRQLVLTRQRSQGRIERLTLRRVGRGRYAGSAAFWVALRCLGRTYRLGSHVPFRLTLTVAQAVQVENVRFARALTATYDNPRRTDSTPCPLGPSHDAATYTGTATAPVPGPPVAGYSDVVDPSTQSASFTDTAQPGPGGATLVAVAWNFGDPGSGADDTSSLPNPEHHFSAPGSYAVSFTVADANGLLGTITQTVTVPPPLLPSGAQRRGP